METYKAAFEHVPAHPAKQVPAEQFVGYLMSHPDYTCHPHDTLDTLIDALGEMPLIPVLNKERQVVGVLSAEAIAAIPAEQHASTLVADAMGPPAVTVPVEKRAYQLAGIMIKHGVHCVPVVNKHNKLMGVVTSKEICEALEH